MTGPTPQTPRQWHARVWALTWPVVLANLTIPLVGAVDTAVMGRLPDPAYIGAVAVGATIFNAVYWLFGFLRMGTTGLAAQGYGAGALDRLAAIASRALLTAATLGLALLALQSPIADLALRLFDEASSTVRGLAGEYFAVRIWGAPGLLSYLVCLGMLFGLQRMTSALVLSLLLNLTNVLLDLLFVLGLGWGVRGVAAATVSAEWLAGLAGLYLVWKNLRRLGWQPRRPPALLDPAQLLGLFDLSFNLVLRTFFVQLPFFVFTVLAAGFGDVVLAANAVLMQFFFVMSYGLDGAAHTAETLAGHAYGAGDPASLRAATRYTLLWSLAMAGLFSLAYACLGGTAIDLLTQADSVRAAARDYLPWAIAAPLAGVLAFLFDGVFIGTTRVRVLRNTVFLATALYGLLIWQLKEPLGNHGLWLALLAFLLARGVLLSLCYPSLLRRTAAAG